MVGFLRSRRDKKKEKKNKKKKDGNDSTSNKEEKSDKWVYSRLTNLNIFILIFKQMLLSTFTVRLTAHAISVLSTLYRIRCHVWKSNSLSLDKSVHGFKLHVLHYIFRIINIDFLF